MKKVQTLKERLKMNTIKKSTIAIFAVLLVFIGSIFRVFAGENPKVTFSKIEDAKRGDEVEVNLNLATNKDYTGIRIDLEYDSDALEYIDQDLNKKTGISRLSYEIATVQEGEKGRLSIVFGIAAKDTTTGESIYANVDNNLGNIYFEVKDTASGKYDLNVTNIQMYKVDGVGNETDVPVDVEEGSIFVKVPVDENSIALEKSNFEIQKDKTDTIKINYTPEDTTDEKGFSYVSNDETVATVDGTGKITAVKPGRTTITVTAFGKTLTANVEVVSHITEVKITGSKTELSKNEELQLSAEILPSDTNDDKTLTWESTNTSVATVDGTGKVTAKAGGETTITATSKNNIVGTYTIKVVVPMTNFTSNVQSLTLTKGTSQKIDTTITPEDTTDNKTITWTSNKPTIATVDSNGNVTGIAGGKATITGKLENNREVTVEVTVEVPIEKIELDKGSIELYPEQKQTLHATITPEDTTDEKTITWSSADTSIATVNNGEVTAVASGTTEITASVGNKSVKATVRVLKTIDNITISESTLTLNRNESKKLSVTITPEDADEDKTIEWKSSDATSVSVTNDGTIKALKITTTPVTITATLKNGKKTECNVTVVAPITKVEINKTSAKIEKGKTEKLTLTITPEDTTDDTTVTWSSNNTEVATVDANGTVTAKKAGNAVISAKVGNFEKECAVEVIVPITGIEITNKVEKIDKGATKDLTARILPEDTTDNKTITWSSSKTDVATVDANGTIVARGAGKTTITAKVGTKTDSFELEVIVPITEFTLDKSKTEIVKGKTEKLNPTITPNDTTENKKITWTSNSPTIATVDENGVVTAVSEGTTKITGKLENGREVSIDVTVKIIPVEDIEISEEELTLKKNSGKILNISLKPLNATEGEEVEWTSSDPTIATVDENGNVKALKKGKVTITAKMGNFTKTAEVTVEEVPLESISLDNNSKKITVGETAELKVTLNPTDTTDDVKLTFKSSDENIIKVDENGKIKAIGLGKAKITVTTDTGITSEIEITVTSIASPKTGVTAIGVYLVILLILSAIAVTVLKVSKRMNK